MQTSAVRKSYIGLLLSLGIAFVVGAIGSVASINAPAFYIDLVQPDWAPPPAVFGPVWTVLYIMMAVSAWLVWVAGTVQENRLPLSIYLVQLVFNAIWSWLFFAWSLGLAAFIDIILLWILIAITLVLFWRIRPLAGLLLIPYLVWVSFAAYLNFSVWQLNPQILGG